MLGLLGLILELGTEDSTCYGAHDTVAAHLVASKVSSGTSTKRAHQASVALSLCVGIGRAVGLLARLAVGVVALRVLVLRIGALLRELVGRLSPWVGPLLLAILSLLLLVVWSYLAVLETTVCWSAILLASAAIVVLGRCLLLGVGRLLVAGLVIAGLLRIIWGLGLRGVLLLVVLAVLVVLVVLIVGARHCDGLVLVGGRW